MNILLGNVNVKLGRKDNYKSAIGNASHDISNDKGVHIQNSDCQKSNVPTS
jgi:hypothetical protein